MSKEFILTCFVLYLTFLFLVAKYFESSHYYKSKYKYLLDRLIYIFGFGAYCTTWTYYGSIEGVTHSGIKFLTIYIGPVLGSILWALTLKKLIKLKEKHGITNIPDLINVLYNIKDSKRVSIIVTTFFTIGLIPYIALQLKSVTRTTNYILKQSDQFLHMSDYLIALSFIVLTTYFSNKKVNESKKKHGLSAIIAVESIVKLIGVIIVGIYITYYKFDGFNDLLNSSSLLLEKKEEMGTFSTIPPVTSWVGLLFLSCFAFLFIPRQFHMAVVENKSINDVKHASWSVPLYLLCINFFIIPIALFGMFYSKSLLPPDLILLGIPAQEGLKVMTMIVFLGGYSAAAGMVVLEITTLSSMLTNNVILPYLQKRNSFLTSRLSIIRKIVMTSLLAVSYFYMHIAGNTAALISMGLISFACVFQISPTIIGGLFWNKANKKGAIYSLASGIIIWSYTLFIPAFLKSSPSLISIVTDGPYGISFLKPYSLFGVTAFDPVTHSLFWSTLISYPVYIFFSLKGNSEEQLNITANQRFSNDVKKENFSIQSKEFNQRVDIMLNKFFTKSDTQIIMNDLDSILDIAKIHINYDDFNILINKLQVILFETIGSIAANIEIKDLLAKEELEIYEHANFQRIQKQIIAQEKLNSLSELTSGIAHEILNPLNISINASSLLTVQIDSNEEKEDVKKTNQMISKNLHRINSIVKKMSKMTKSSTGLSEPGDITLIIKECCQLTKEIAMKSHSLEVDVVVNSKTKVKFFNFNKDELRRVFNYILDNSLYSILEKRKKDKEHKAMISVDISFFMNMVRIELLDNGQGIQKGEINKLFTPFYTTKPTGKGNLGLGLTRANDIVMAHKGSITIESEYTKNTKVVITIPY